MPQLNVIEFLVGRILCDAGRHSYGDSADAVESKAVQC
jgi:hypothetical protein